MIYSNDILLQVREYYYFEYLSWIEICKKRHVGDENE